MKRFFINMLAFVAGTIMFSSCIHDEIALPSSGVPEGYMNITFGTDVPDMQTVQVRAVDPDGIDIHNMKLFCFNPYGLFITSVDAEELNPASGTSGTFKATVPEETKIIHFIANQNSNLYSNEDFMNKTEAAVLADMEGASGMLIYWSRFEASANGKVLKEELAALGKVEMIRNQAKVSIADWNTPYMTVTGFVTTGIHAFGTVAPHSNEDGFVWPGTDDFITLPHNLVLMSGIEDVNTKDEDYIFEHENSVDSPVSVIIKGIPQGGTEELYYRVALVDANGEQLRIRRNHSYVLNITGKLSYGKETFAEALDAPFTNNVWITIDSWVKEVQDQTYRLLVEETGIVLDADMAGREYTVHYNISRIDNAALTASDKAQVSWLGVNDVAEHNIVSHVFDTSTGKGSVTVKLNPMLNDIQMGTLLVKKGRLQRTVEINVVKTQLFTPSWVGTQVYGAETGQFVTIKFTIPEETPDILFPFPVLITVNSLDVRAASGMQLPVVRKGEEQWFGDDYEGHDYKYEYIVEAPGVHRLYFENILGHAANEKEPLWLEAKFFETLKKEFTFSGNQYAITVSGLGNYIYEPENPGNETAKKDTIFYKLVPKKRFAPVDFHMVMRNNADNKAFDVGANDEFLFYSKSLDFYSQAEADAKGITLECNYYPVPENIINASTNGRSFMFQPKNTAGTPTGHYEMHLKTNRAVSDDLVRIASNQEGNMSILTGNGYTGNSYRSMIFELATYRPFRFAALVNGAGEYSTGQNEETVSNVELTYLPDQDVDITFDVTSFEGSDGACVDPFGEEFEIYIDAPMLKIDGTRLAECNVNDDKLKEVSPGRFVYTVAAARDAERAFGTGSALLVDDSDGCPGQNGERKTLPFKTKKITTAGEITLSSNEEKVVFYKKTFKVTNKTIDGTIHYNAGGVNTPVKAGEFVAFARTKDGVRIGSVNVVADGKYSLYLRSEYEFNWTGEGVEFDYIAKDGKVYDLELSNLSSLFNNPDIMLELAN